MSNYWQKRFQAVEEMNNKRAKETVQSVTPAFDRVQAQTEAAEKEYWQNIPYDEAVNAEIRKRYTESQEFAILRQKDEKPSEYATYYAYCEECKTLVKEMKAK